MNKSVRTIQFQDRLVGDGHPAYIIAEIGINYNGDLSLAKQLIDAAKEAGVDAVKVQIVSADHSYAKSSASYPIFKNIELNTDQWKELIDYTELCGLHFLATFVNDYDLSQFEDIEFCGFKISSTNITNYLLLESISRYQRPIILSTGMSTLEEVQQAVSFLHNHGAGDVAILQCTSLYPTLIDEVNLNVIPELREVFASSVIGFSDHTEGYECALGALSKGASLFEKHFTLDKSMEGPDHHFSLNPDELKIYVQKIHLLEQALGSAHKAPVKREEPLRKEFRRKMVALTTIQAGETLTKKNIGAKRARGEGLEPKDFELIEGKKAVCLINEDQVISLDKIQ